MSVSLPSREEQQAEQSRSLALAGQRVSGIDQCGETQLPPKRSEVRPDQRTERAAAHFAAILKSSADAIVGKDLRGIVTSWNLGAERIFGYAASEMIGQSITRLIPPERQDEEEYVLGRIREGKSVEHYETVRVTKDGRRIEISLTVSPIINSAGELVGASKVARDITEAKRADAAFQESQHTIRLTLEAAQIGHWNLDLRTHTATRSLQHDQIFGYEELLADWSYEKFLTHVHPEDRENVDRLFQAGVAAKTDWDFECRIVRRDGALRWIWAHGNVFTDAAGETVKMLGMVSDITERKLAEEALRESEQQTRLFMEATADCVWYWDLITGHVGRNVGFQRAFGYSAQEIDSSVTWWEERLHPDDRERVLSTFRETMASGGNACSYEYRFRRKDGTHAVIHDHACIVRDAKGKPLRALGAMTDITERKEAERQIEHFADLFRSLSHRLLNVQEEERRHLARELHDEIGQTLTAAKLNLKIIAADVPPAVAGRLEDSVQLLDRLHEQVRQLSLDLRPPLLDELGLVPALRWLADQQAQRGGLRVTFTANVDRLDMDPPQRTACFRVAQEALTNAVRHARAATVAVEVQAEPDRVWLVVQDDGVGFDKDEMQQRAKGGASIGLLSMNERFSLLGGELEVNSAPGRGTEIRAWLPLAPPAPNVTPENA